MAKRKAGTLSSAAKHKAEPTPEEKAQVNEIVGEVLKGKNFKQTSTGYMKSDGTEIKRLSVFLSIQQIDTLKQRALSEKKSISEYVAEKLGL